MEVATATLIRYIRSPKVSDQELINYIRHRSILIRANALLALAERARIRKELAEVISESARDPTNVAAVLMGTVTVAHVAIGCLLRLGTPTSITEAEHIIYSYVGAAREDLIWYLRSEGLLPT